jgi:dihydrofolate reductase
MRKITAIESISLDGVLQAPGRPDEDTRGGFAHGGWATPYSDAVMFAEMSKDWGKPGALLLGRRTYEDFASFWPKQTDGNPYTEQLDRIEKYVASTTLTEPLGWQNSTLLRGDAVEAVTRLRQEAGPDITILGSGELVRTLLRHDLIDRFVLLTHPLLLGSGQRLFAEDGILAKLHLVTSTTTTTGVVIATYERK